MKKIRININEDTYELCQDWRKAFEKNSALYIRLGRKHVAVDDLEFCRDYYSLEDNVFFGYWLPTNYHGEVIPHDSYEKISTMYVVEFDTVGEGEYRIWKHIN